jgi:hypothetical protein
MPDPSRLLRTLQRAVQAFRDTPGRRGRIVYLTDAEDVMVVGDLHGNVENFRSALNIAQLNLHPKRHLVLQELIHGPFHYGDGTDKSHQLVDLVSALKCKHPQQVHLILGNHELAQMMAQDIVKTEAALNASFRRGVAYAYGADARKIYETYRNLFDVVPLAVRTPNRVFVSHSLPAAKHIARFNISALEKDRLEAAKFLQLLIKHTANADDLEKYDQQDYAPGGPIYAMLWGRDTRPTTVGAFLRKVDCDLLITGHIRCPEGFSTPNEKQLILDAQVSPGGYCLFPANRPVTQAELIANVGTL